MDNTTIEITQKFKVREELVTKTVNFNDLEIGQKFYLPATGDCIKIPYVKGNDGSWECNAIGLNGVKRIFRGNNWEVSIKEQKTYNFTDIPLNAFFSDNKLSFVAYKLGGISNPFAFFLLNSKPLLYDATDLVILDKV